MLILNDPPARFPAVFQKHGMVVHDGTLLDGEMVVDEVAPGKGLLHSSVPVSNGHICSLSLFLESTRRFP